MASRYDEVLAAIFKGRKLTKGMITGDPTDMSQLPPMVDEPNQGEIDAEQARRFREALDNERFGGGN